MWSAGQGSTAVYTADQYFSVQPKYLTLVFDRALDKWVSSRGSTVKIRPPAEHKNCWEGLLEIEEVSGDIFQMKYFHVLHEPGSPPYRWTWRLALVISDLYGFILIQNQWPGAFPERSFKFHNCVFIPAFSLGSSQADSNSFRENVFWITGKIGNNLCYRG